MFYLGNHAYVIGAATAGLIAAKRLAARGVHTTVYDQKRTLGVPVRASGILSISGLAELDLKYESSITNTLYGAHIHCGNETMSVVSKTPVAHILERQRLNDICFDEAVGEGAEVITGERMDSARLTGLSGQGVIVGADGAVSTVASTFGMGSMERFVLTYKAEYEVRAPDPRMVDLFFDNSTYKGLFAWLAPNEQDVLEVGVGIESTSGNAKAAFDAFVRQKGVGNLVGGIKPLSEGACMIPMAMRKRIADDAKGIVLVGDAAGQVKPTTGGGIIFGGKAAGMAAEAVARHLEGTGRLSDYEREFRRRHGADLWMHSMINRTYRSMGQGSMGAALKVMRTFGIDRFLGRYGDMDRPSLILKRFFLRNLA